MHNLRTQRLHSCKKNTFGFQQRIFPWRSLEVKNIFFCRPFLRTAVFHKVYKLFLCVRAETFFGGVSCWKSQGRVMSGRFCRSNVWQRRTCPNLDLNCRCTLQQVFAFHPSNANQPREGAYLMRGVFFLVHLGAGLRFQSCRRVSIRSCLLALSPNFVCKLLDFWIVPGGLISRACAITIHYSFVYQSPYIFGGG